MPAGTEILVEGRGGEHLYLIKSGEVEVFTGLGDQRIDLARLQPGEIFGEISVLTGMPATANVRACAPTELITLTRTAVVALAERNHQLAHLLSTTKEHRVHETVARLQTEGFVSARRVDRLALFC